VDTASIGRLHQIRTEQGAARTDALKLFSAHLSKTSKIEY